jgi:cyclophilin family peptidyl-prolyl cis-trans isomerase
MTVFGVIEPSTQIEPASETNGVCGEGPVSIATITVGPFDLHRRYRSMEGPYVQVKTRIEDLVRSKGVVAPEEAVKFLEKNAGTIAMTGTPTDGHRGSAAQGTENPGILYWFKGCKLEVLDENGAVLPTAEFICHLNINLDSSHRNQLFPDGNRCTSDRILTMTQGQTDMVFPAGFGVPVAGDETWRFLFQAANRTTDVHRRVKQRLTLYFIRDQDLIRSVTALSWVVPHVEVVVDKFTPEIIAKEKSECPLCVGESQGVNAPNSGIASIQTDVYGRKVSGHWVIPPGKSNWTSIFRDSRFSQKPETLHAVWTHVHPFCTSISLIGISPSERKTIFTAHCRTKAKPGLVEIEHIDLIISRQGMVLPPHNTYEIDVAYNNVSDQPADSMASLGIFTEDSNFVRPDWAYRRTSPADTSVTETTAAKVESGGLPIFDQMKDGPILSAPKTVTILTTGGKLIFQLNPHWAPKTATQMAKLFENHAYDGTEIRNYVPGFIFQIPLAEVKAPGFAPATVSQRALVKRIPVEVESQNSQQVSHTAGVLSMARRDDDLWDNTSSFSILLGDAHHLDGKMTIFGKLTKDPENENTLEKMIANWPQHPVIIKTLSVN